MSFQMTEDEIKLLSDYVRDYCGLLIHDSQELLFQKRVKKRVDANKLVSAKEYYHFLRFDSKGAEEMRELVNILTVNETYFFRESPHMEMFSNLLFRILKTRNTDKKILRIWSAACSNGAEPYSLAILIVESGMFPLNDWKIEIVGTDINTEMVRAARKGVFTASAFRITPAQLRDKYFKEIEKGCWEVDDKIKRMVSFSQMNLHSASQMRLVRDMDVILCRNVLIYFDDTGKKEVVERFYDSLAPEGYLVIGQSESLFRITNVYNIVPMGNAILYQREHESQTASASR